MRIGQVIGTVTLSRSHPALGKRALKLVVPCTLAELASGAAPAGEELVADDELGANVGTRIAFSEGGEAAQPFYPEDRPVDAYNAAILDAVSLATPRPARSKK